MKAYFFINEKLASFLATDHFANLDRVFGIGGGGDFAFNLLLRADRSSFAIITYALSQPRI